MSENWVYNFGQLAPPPPHLDPEGGGGGTHSLAGERVGGANADGRPETLALCKFCENNYLFPENESDVIIHYRNSTHLLLPSYHHVHTDTIREVRLMKTPCVRAELLFLMRLFVQSYEAEKCGDL